MILCRTMQGTQEGSRENSCYSICHSWFISIVSHKYMAFKQLLLVSFSPSNILHGNSSRNFKAMGQPTHLPVLVYQSEQRAHSEASPVPGHCRRMTAEWNQQCRQRGCCGEGRKPWGAEKISNQLDTAQKLSYFLYIYQISIPPLCQGAHGVHSSLPPYFTTTWESGWVERNSVTPVLLVNTHHWGLKPRSLIPKVTHLCITVT